MRVFHTSVDGFPLEFDWQQISSSLQDSSQYSCQSQQYCSLDGLHSSSYFLLSLYLVTVSSAPIAIGFTVTFMFHSFFLVLWQDLGTDISFRFLSVLHCCQLEQQNSVLGRFSFLLSSILLMLLFIETLWVDHYNYFVRMSKIWLIQIYIYIYSHPQTDCFVLSELFSVARHAGRSKPGSKPVQLYVRLCFRPLVHQADHVG